MFCLSQTFEFKNFAFPNTVKYFSVLPYPNIAILDFCVFNNGIHCIGYSKHWTDCRFCWFFQTLEFYILAFPNIAIQCFWLYEHWNLVLLLLQTLEFWILPFPYNVIQCFISSKHWTFRFGSVFPDIRIQCFSFSKRCMEFWILALKKNWDSVFCILQTLEFKNFAFRKIAFQCFRLSKHWNSGFWLFQH